MTLMLVTIREQQRSLCKELIHLIWECSFCTCLSLVLAAFGTSSAEQWQQLTWSRLSLLAFIMLGRLVWFEPGERSSGDGSWCNFNQSLMDQRWMELPFWQKSHQGGIYLIPKRNVSMNNATPLYPVVQTSSTAIDFLDLKGCTERQNTLQGISREKCAIMQKIIHPYFILSGRMKSIGSY